MKTKIVFLFVVGPLLAALSGALAVTTWAAQDQRGAVTVGFLALACALASTGALFAAVRGFLDDTYDQTERVIAHEVNRRRSSSKNPEPGSQRALPGDVDPILKEHMDLMSAVANGVAQAIETDRALIERMASMANHHASREEEMTLLRDEAAKVQEMAGIAARPRGIKKPDDEIDEVTHPKKLANGTGRLPGFVRRDTNPLADLERLARPVDLDGLEQVIKKKSEPPAAAD